MAGDSLIPDALAHLDPRRLDYGEWLSVGMAMKAEGMAFGEFAAWSRQNTERYKSDADLLSHWRSFDEKNAASPVKGGTIVELARRQGFEQRPRGQALGWDMTSATVVDMAWVEDEDIAGTGEDPASMLSRYLEALFDADDNVGYVTDSFDRDGRKTPANAGYYDRTAGELLAALKKHGSIEAALGASDPEGGAWIRFNPLDGQGARNANVTAFRHALVECDEMGKEKQLAMIRALNLPCAAIVDSGGKSVHAIVKVDAPDYDEYRKRVDFLYETCRKSGMPIDAQNKNPSRLSRMPGVMRKGSMQALISTDEGARSWDEWREWLDEETDDLPDTETLASVWDSMPPLAEPLIGGILRRGHKMTLAGPSKAGKSVMLMELAVAIAEGKEWIGFSCAQGPVLYVNLEIDRASCLHRMREIYDSLGIEPARIGDVHVWSLRGKARPFDRLAPRLIRRAVKIRPAAIIIDPIYKIITGDENSASEMAAFTALFDMVAAEVGCAIIVCHHHSKGFQGQKLSMDRASGSGVFARDPDVLADMSPLWLDKPAREWAHQHRPPGSKQDMTGWRMSFTVREFEDPGDVDVWFGYPRHFRDESGLMAKCGVEGDPETSRAKGSELGNERRKENTRSDHIEIVSLIDEAVKACYEAHAAPTRANVLYRIGEYKGKAVTEGQLRSWTRDGAEWSPYRMVKQEGDKNPANAIMMRIGEEPPSPQMVMDLGGADDFNY